MSKLTGIELIARERQEQLNKHGRTVEQDYKNNTKGQLAYGAAQLCYDMSVGDSLQFKPEGWDEKIWSKMCNRPYKEQLIIAGALIAAEIDRQQY